MKVWAGNGGSYPNNYVMLLPSLIYHATDVSYGKNSTQGWVRYKKVPGGGQPGGYVGSSWESNVDFTAVAAAMEEDDGGHSYSRTKNPTCQAEGVDTCICCPATRSVAKVGHSYTVTKSEATCTSPKILKCQWCNATTTSGSANGHNWGSGNGSLIQNQSCTLPEIRYNKCLNCTATNGTKQTKAALGHNWQTATLSNNNGIKLRPTVYSDAVFYQKCSRCVTGSSNDPYTKHFNVVPNTKDFFTIYIGEDRVKKISLGETLIMDASFGENNLVESVV